jgi:exodeoxyribonuclease VII small subunit
MAKAKKDGTFEDRLGRLEAIVRGLESGEKGLEESLALFEEGVTLARSLTQRLEDVKRKVEVLTKDAEGKLKLAPLDEREGQAS